MHDYIKAGIVALVVLVVVYRVSFLRTTLLGIA